MSGQLYMTQVTEAIYVEDKLFKTILAPYLETPKDIASKSEETYVYTGQSCTIMQIFTSIGPRYLSLGQKYIFFLIGDSLGATIPCHTFLESSHLDATPHLTCNAATYHFQDICCQNLGFWGPLGIPQGQTLCPGPISTSMQNFTPTGVTVTVISVTKQIH